MPPVNQVPPINQVPPSNVPPAGGQQFLQSASRENPQLVAFANEYAIIALFTFSIPVLGLVYAIKGRKEADRIGGAGRRFATAGLILSIIITVFYALLLILPAILTALLGVAAVSN